MSEINQKNVDSVNEHLKKDTHLVKTTANLEERTHRWVNLEYGPTDDGDYVIHFSDFHEQRNFPPEKAELFAKIIFTHFDSIIPAKFVKDYYPSPGGWEKSVISLMIRGIHKEWNFEQLYKEKLLEKLEPCADHLSDEIEAGRTIRKFV